MAWETLPVDYMDAIWSGLKRYMQVNNDDGTVSFQDVTTYSQKENSFFGAMEANRMNEAMNEIMSMLEHGSGLHTGAGAHNSIYRGKYLGDTVTAEQYAAISGGTFENLYIGDYWTINGVTYRIAAFDYFYNSGDTNCTTHHALMVPDTCLYNAAMNTSNVATGGYSGSAMCTANLENAKTTIKTAFPSHVMMHRSAVQLVSRMAFALLSVYLKSAPLTGCVGKEVCQIMYTITLADGTKLKSLELNGNNYIATKIIEDSVFEGNLGTVVIFDGEITETHTDMVLAQNQAVDGKSWFILGEMSAQEKELQALRAEVKRLLSKESN